MTTFPKPSPPDETLVYSEAPLPRDEAKLEASANHESRQSIAPDLSTLSLGSPSDSNAEESSDDDLMTVDLFPYNTPMEELRRHGFTKFKKVHWVRHVEGYHNVGESNHPCNIDAHITPKGLEQCRSLADSIRDAPEDSNLNDVLTKTELIVTSPVTRCVETAIHGLEPVMKAKPDVPLVANDSIRETVNFHCDRRRPIHEIAKDFPQVDFTQACPHDEDNIWEYYMKKLGDDKEYTKERESAEIHTIADRCRKFFVDWLRKRPEENIVVCCHNTISRCIFNFGMKDGMAPTDAEQVLDDRDEPEDVPLVSFHANLEGHMRKEYENGELRSMIIAYK